MRYSLAEFKSSLCCKCKFTSVLFLLSLSGAGSALWAQSQKIVLHGSLIMTTGEKFPYRLSIHDSSDIAKGFSYTYEAPDDTKATIRGEIDKQNKTLSFTETGIVSSHDVHTQAFMCLIHAKLFFKKDEYTGRVVLKGSIKGTEADNTACTDGAILFENEDEIRELFSTHDPSDTVIEMHPGAKRVVETEPPATESEIVKMEKITSGLERVYEWKTDSAVLEIWDGGHIDGDMVTVAYNGVDQIKKYYLAKTHKRMVLPVKGTAMNILTILADNEGSEPPNTANIRLCDGNKCYDLLSYNTKGQTSIIKLKRSQQ